MKLKNLVTAKEAHEAVSSITGKYKSLRSIYTFFRTYGIVGSKPFAQGVKYYPLSHVESAIYYCLNHQN